MVAVLFWRQSMIKKLKYKLYILFSLSILTIFTIIFSLFVYQNINAEKEGDISFFKRMTTYHVEELEGLKDYTTAFVPYENYNQILQLRTSDNTLLSQSYYSIQANILMKDGSFSNLYCLKESKSFLDRFKEHAAFYIGIWFVIFVSILLLTKYLILKAMKPTEIALQGQKEFIAAVSHELKSPLAVILSSAEYISSCDAFDDVKRQSEVIDEECLRMSKLIQDLLLLSSADTNTWSLNKTQINLDTFLIKLYEKYEHICQKEHILLRLDMPNQESISLFADEVRLNQILSILIDNAIHYSFLGGEIMLSTTIIKNKIIFRVIDHGIGIKEEDKPYIYDRFFCADRSRSRRNHYGLGLSIAKELIGMQKGTIELKDTLGGGCTFIVSLALS